MVNLGPNGWDGPRHRAVLRTGSAYRLTAQTGCVRAPNMAIWMRHFFAPNHRMAMMRLKPAGSR